MKLIGTNKLVIMRVLVVCNLAVKLFLYNFSPQLEIEEAASDHESSFTIKAQI